MFVCFDQSRADQFAAQVVSVTIIKGNFDGKCDENFERSFDFFFVSFSQYPAADQLMAQLIYVVGKLLWKPEWKISLKF